MRSATKCAAPAWKRLFRGASAGLLLASPAGVTATQAQPTSTETIYSCVDARGRKLTSDRSIPECSDREQKLLNTNGTLKGTLKPVPTTLERLAQEAKVKAEQDEQARINDEKRRDRALLIRYPTPAMHDKERAQALAQIGVVRQAAVKRVDELVSQRTAINQELAFYKKDPGKAPPALSHRVNEVAQSLAVQERFMAEQDGELRRINARFDNEQGRLKQLWSMQPGVPPTGASRAP